MIHFKGECWRQEHCGSSYKQSNAFSHFLWCSNEKVVLGAALCLLIGERKVARLLDIGAGDGSLTKMLSQRAESTVIIEPSERLILAVQQQGIENLTVYQKDLYGVGDLEPADVTLVSHALYFIPDWQRAIQKALSLTRGRLFIVHLANIGNYANLLDTFMLPLSGNLPISYSDRLSEILHLMKLPYQVIRVESNVVLPSVDEAMFISEFLFDSLQQDWDPAIKRRLREWFENRLSDKGVCLTAYHDIFSINLLWV